MTEKPSSRDQFSPVAEKYLTSAVHSNADALRRLVELVQPTKGEVLDVGTGAGHTAYTFAPHVNEVVAFDLTPEMLAIVEREAKAKNLPNISTQLGDAQDMPFEENTFDGVTCRVAAHHFPKVENFVKEVARVLKPNGWFMLADTVSPEDDPAAQIVNEVEELRDPSHVYNLKVSQWRHLLEENGLAVTVFEQHRKNLDYQDWLDRMKVPEATRPVLERKIFDSKGLVRQYFMPATDGNPRFDLIEGLFLATKTTVQPS